MSETMSSRERTLAAISCEAVDHVPLAFMIFGALSERLEMGAGDGGPAAAIEAQLDLGLDVVVHLSQFSPRVEGEVGHSDAPGLPVRLGPEVETREWAETGGERRYPVLHKEYATPSGTLSVAVDQTDDWPYGDAVRGDFHVPLMDDYLAPRCSKYLVEGRQDLAALRHLLVPPREGDLEICAQAWREGRDLATRHDLLLAGGWGVGGDALAWFCGLQNAVMMAVDEPELLAELLGMVAAWNRPRMQAFLDFGVDLFVRRAWYEGTDFWSPRLFDQFFIPIIREEVRQAHEAGAKYGYILTSGSMPLHQLLMEAGVDVLIGPDPVQGQGTDLRRMGAELGDRMCAWGGVNGFITVEMGTTEEIDVAVREATEALGPRGLILSPVDNVRDPSDEAWARVLDLVASWKAHRG